MPLYFVVFLAMLAASLMLYLGAAVTSIVTRRPPPSFVHERAVGPLQATGVALLWSSVGAGWLLFFNVYRIHVDMSALGRRGVSGLQPGLHQTVAHRRAALRRNLPGVVARPLGRPRTIHSPGTVVDCDAADRLAGEYAICSTAQDAMQAHGYSEDAYRRLQTAHLIRTLAVTIAAVWALPEVWRQTEHLPTTEPGAPP